MTFQRPTRTPVTVEVGASLRDAAELMAERRVGFLVVVDGAGHQVGVLTDRDLCTRAVAFDRDPDAATVAGAMTSPVRTGRADSTLGAQFHGLERAGVRRLPLMDGDGAIHSSLVLDDALLWISERLSDLAGTAARARRASTPERLMGALVEVREAVEAGIEQAHLPEAVGRFVPDRELLGDALQRLRGALVDRARG